MTKVTPDVRTSSWGVGSGGGLAIAVLSALAFGTSGTFAKGLLETGWTPAAAVTARVWIGGLVLAVPGAIALRGRWGLLRRHAMLLAVYGIVAVAGCQFAYFSAVQHMEVGLALLIEYVAPVAVIGWLWLRHGERPTRLIVLGGLVAAVGLLLVLDLVGGARVSTVGVAWALLAMLGAACYFLLSAHAPDGLPPVTLASGGLLVGAIGLSLAGASGVLQMSWGTADASYAGTAVPWWLPILGLGVISAAVAYATGIVASRRLGSRLASFVALTEVLAALGFAWMFLDELPRPMQLVGGVLVLAGVVVVRLGEREEQLVAPPVIPA